eukprot:5079022-Amphidinium_carterae.1
MDFGQTEQLKQTLLTRNGWDTLEYMAQAEPKETLSKHFTRRTEDKCVNINLEAFLSLAMAAAINSNNGSTSNLTKCQDPAAMHKHVLTMSRFSTCKLGCPQGQQSVFSMAAKQQVEPAASMPPPQDEQILAKA